MKLNSFLIILFIILKQIYAQCFEPVDKFKLEKRIRKVACGKWVTEKDINKVKINDNKLVGGNETMFQVIFTCLISDSVMCAKAQKAFDDAGITIANTLKLKEKIMVNATLMNFCGEGNNVETCSSAGSHKIGLSKPLRFYSLLSDDDKMERICPQALVKQFQFPEHPQYDEFDIFIRFNSRVNFYFSEDTTPISPLQFDFEFVATHELLHGLGFSTFWRLYDDEDNNLKTLCPPIVVLNSGNDEKVEFDYPDESITVKESIFDKYMIRLDNGSSITEYTKNIERYIVNNQNTTDEEFLQSQLPTMREVFALATTPKSLPLNSNIYVTDAVILETFFYPDQVYPM